MRLRTYIILTMLTSPLTSSHSLSHIQTAPSRGDWYSFSFPISLTLRTLAPHNLLSRSRHSTCSKHDEAIYRPPFVLAPCRRRFRPTQSRSSRSIPRKLVLYFSCSRDKTKPTSRNRLAPLPIELKDKMSKLNVSEAVEVEIGSDPTLVTVTSELVLALAQAQPLRWLAMPPPRSQVMPQLR
jgi:hypothetical protein